MSRIQLVWLHLSIALTAITGTVFAVMKYFLESTDEFSVVNHPLQPHMLAAHVVVAPAALFLLGWVFSNHMLPKLRFGDGRNQRTGVASMWLILPMTLSAYLLQIATNESVRQAMAVAHWATSGVFAVSYTVHLIIGRRIRQASE
ncbi:MAG TPA: hypothetical protein VEK57_19030 [Thermoanaerobaculia bacterium]|nr:hypothetical protein [Thermoanaerobaculia bacterium]